MKMDESDEHSHFSTSSWELSIQHGGSTCQAGNAICGRLRRHMGLELRLAEWNKTSLSLGNSFDMLFLYLSIPKRLDSKKNIVDC